MSTARHKSQPQGRSLPKSIAAVAEAFEGERRRLVRTQDIARALDAPVGSVRVRNATRMMRQEKWLVGLPARGTYEFIPGAAGGPYSSGDRWLELKAATEKNSRIRAQVGLTSAAFLHGFAQRSPATDTIFLDRSVRDRSLEKVYEVVHVLPDRLFGAEDRDGVAVSTPERLVIEAAVWWQHAGDLRDSDHWLRRASEAIDPVRLRALLKSQPPAVAARVGYLLERFGRSDADQIIRHKFRGPARIGPTTGRTKRFDAKWRVYDTIGVASV